MSVEIFSVDKYFVDTFKNDVTMQGYFGGTVRIHVGEAPEKTATPYIVFDEIETYDRTGVGGVRIFTKPQFSVDVFGSQGYYALKNIADRVDTLLVANSGVSVEGIWINKFIRDRVVRDVDNIDGVRYWMVRQIYRTIIHPG